MLHIAIAKRFSEMLVECIGEENMKVVVERNSTEEYSGLCASHDFCDANHFACEAFQEVTGKEYCGGSDSVDEASDTALMNSVWDYAKEHTFKV